ncbi:MAG: glucokinase [Deltaproteobacteria bacterium]|nr:glucokinase [Deltaproteobacteria bacterium]
MAKGRTQLMLAGDVGGTKTYLGLFVRDGDCLEAVREGAFGNSDFKDHMEIIGDFLDREVIGDIASASFGIASPVFGGRCRLTNLHWVIDAGRIGKRFKIGRVELINDLVATAWGMGYLHEDEFKVLQKGRPVAGNAALIAAGTGLGECMLFWDGKAHIPSASEGGHADFAPRSGLEIELLQYLIKTYGHVSYERVLSGQGLKNIYDFLTARRNAPAPERLRKGFESGDAASVVAQEAMRGNDKDCALALELFASVYGGEAGNLALKCMASAGLYVGGGIAPKMLKALEGGAFIRSFRDKGRFEGYLGRVPVKVILFDRTALLGAAAHAAGHAAGSGKRIKEIRVGGRTPSRRR